MPTVPGFWDVGPHDPLNVEAIWRECVRSYGGVVLDELLPKQRSFENADFWFDGSGIVLELKEIETEFSSGAAYKNGFDAIMRRLVREHPDWRPALLGGRTPTPQWVNTELSRLYRPPLARLLKKANRQLRATKEHLGKEAELGVLLLANDGLISLEPEWIRALTCSLLLHSYSSIDCFVYQTVNRYVETPGDDMPCLLWVPTYSERAPDRLVSFIDGLGRHWFDLLETRIGFTHRSESGQQDDFLRGVKAIILPPSHDG